MLCVNVSNGFLMLDRNKKFEFASDNTSGICPQAMKWLQKAASERNLSYGKDDWTVKAVNSIQTLFETDCEVFFVGTGTAANALALASMNQSYQSILCHRFSHIETDECGAPEYASNGAKLILVEGDHGKVDPISLLSAISRRSDIHFPKPKVISLSQATELGTIYDRSEILKINKIARDNNMSLHLDGARFANAVARLGCSPADITWKAGVDVLCFSGTKNGLAAGDLVIFFDKKLAEDFAYRLKQAGHLFSKMWILSAPWLGLLERDIWLSNARHANAMADYFASQFTELTGLSLKHAVQANAVFIDLPENARQSLKDFGWVFYTFIGDGGVRFMCNWSTEKRSVDLLLDDIQRSLG